MAAQKREVRIYQTEEGKTPYKSWFNGLRNLKTKAKIDVRINRIRLGNFGDCSTVGGGVSELRVDHGPGYRIYFGQWDSEIVILLLGGDKSTQQRDIEKAKDYWQDYGSRNDA